jgi:hypothetical protein
MDSQFAESFRAKLNSFSRGLSADPGGVRSLDEKTGLQVLEFLLESVCGSQSIEANRLGTECIAALPRRWLAPRIREAALRRINLDDDYEFRRLLDLFEHLDAPGPAGAPMRDEAAYFAQIGLRHENPDIREDAEIFQERQRGRHRISRKQQSSKRYPVALKVEELNP